MADQLQLRGGTTAEHATFTGALREVTVDTDKDTLVVHDNATAGGLPLLREDLSNLPAGTIDNTDISSSAEIAVSKLADGNARQLLQTDTAGTGVEWTSNVDVPGTLDVTGATTLDSTLSVPLGTAALPSIYPGSDTNTGLFSPGADQLALSTSGTSRLHIASDGKVGVGTSSPGELLHISSATGGPTPIPTALRIETTTSAASWSTTDPWGEINFYSSDPSGSGPKKHAIIDVTSEDANGSRSTLGIKLTGATSGTATRLSISSSGTTTLTSATSTAPFIANIAASEAARIDSSGRLLVGTSTSRGGLFNATGNDSPVQVEGTNYNSSSLSIIRNQNNPAAPHLVFGKTRGTAAGGTTVAQSGDTIGVISFQGSDGTELVEGASIQAQVDGTPAANDMPGRIVLSTTPSGSATPTERARLTSTGALLVGTSTASGYLLEVNGSLRSGSEVRNGHLFTNGTASSGLGTLVKQYNLTKGRISDTENNVDCFEFNLSATGANSSDYSAFAGRLTIVQAGATTGGVNRRTAYFVNILVHRASTGNVTLTLGTPEVLGTAISPTIALTTATNTSGILGIDLNAGNTSTGFFTVTLEGNQVGRAAANDTIIVSIV